MSLISCHSSRGSLCHVKHTATLSYIDSHCMSFRLPHLTLFYVSHLTFMFDSNNPLSLSQYISLLVYWVSLLYLLFSVKSAIWFLYCTCEDALLNNHYFFPCCVAVASAPLQIRSPGKQTENWILLEVKIRMQ